MQKSMRIGQSCSNNARLIELPSEIMTDIFLRLDIESVRSIRCVSKTLLNVVDHPVFVKLLAPRLLPQLMVVCSSSSPEGDSTTLLALQHNGFFWRETKPKTYSTIFFTELWHACSVDFVFGNLFCFTSIAKYGGQCLLFNPLMGGEVLILPTSNVQLPPYLFENWYGMGVEDITSTYNYKIVRVSGNTKYGLLVAQVHVLGTNSWRQIPSVPPCNLSHKKVSAYGGMHWLIKAEEGEENHIRIVSFDFNKEEFNWTIPHPTLRKLTGITHLDYYHLINLKGCLAIVDTSDGRYIEVWTLKDSNKKEWVLDYKIDFRMFLHRIPPIDPYAPCLLFKTCTCGEWQHGIFFMENGVKIPTFFFLNLRLPVSIGCYKHANLLYEQPISMFSYTRSLISLKNYGNLVEAESRSCWPAGIQGLEEYVWKLG